MFVVSLSGKKLRKILFCVVVAIVVLSVVLCVLFSSGTRKNLFAGNSVSVSINNSQDVLEFISSLGWEVDPNPVEIRDVVIPETFDDVYNNYNQIQISQGYNLEKYAGRRAKRWTYVIKNYPDIEEEADYIRINILVCDEEVVGGDVCSIKLDGFMHGFLIDNELKEPV